MRHRIGPAGPGLRDHRRDHDRRGGGLMSSAQISTRIGSAAMIVCATLPLKAIR